VSRQSQQALVQLHAAQMRASLSPAEAALWAAIRGKRLGVMFRRQVVIGSLIVDFCAPAARLIVEVDGRHHEWRRGADASHDAKLRRVRDGTLARSSFKVYVRVLQKRVRAPLVEGETLIDAPKTAKTCAKMQRIFPAFWYFVDQPEVEPTNNAAEQAIRHGVMFRRTSQGTQSAHGSEFVAAMLTVHAPLQQQHRNRDILSFVATACHARLLGLAPPTLLPSVPVPSTHHRPAARAA